MEPVAIRFGPVAVIAQPMPEQPVEVGAPPFQDHPTVMQLGRVRKLPNRRVLPQVRAEKDLRVDGRLAFQVQADLEQATDQLADGLPVGTGPVEGVEDHQMALAGLGQPTGYPVQQSLLLLRMICDPAHDLGPILPRQRLTIASRKLPQHHGAPDVLGGVFPLQALEHPAGWVILIA